MATLPDNNWNYLLTLLPANWEKMAFDCGAVSRLRGFRSAGDILRTLLLHIGHGFSLRTTSVAAKAAGWASLSDVALLKKLRASEKWLQALCVGLLKESKLEVPAIGLESTKINWRLVDSTLVKEPGATGSHWRVLFSLSVPDWQCDFFRLTPAKGKGNGESLKHFKINQGDCLLADRGFSHLAGIEHVVGQGGHIIVRLNEQNTPLQQKNGDRFDLLSWLRVLKLPGQIASSHLWLEVPQNKGAKRIPIRVCAIRKSIEAEALAQRKQRRKAQRAGAEAREVTLEYGAWIVVVTTLPEDEYPADAVLEWYRIRWQIELAFKRLKSLADVGHLPKKDAASCRSWLYGKLLISLVTDKMQRHAASLSPWGGRWLDGEETQEPLA
jgi:Transposase DDE domain